MCTIKDDYLGMEFEVNGYNVYIDNSLQGMGRPIDNESQIKGKVFGLVNIGSNRLVLLTLDTRTGFNPTQDSIETVVELVLFHKDYPIETLKNSECWGSLKEFIKKFNLNNFIVGNQISLYEFDPDNMSLNVKSRKSLHVKSFTDGYIKESDSLMIHLTCACPLGNILFPPAKTDYLCDLVKNLRETNENIVPFIELIDEMILGINSDQDPKQHMDVMNRTSFAAILNQFNYLDRKDIVNYLAIIYQECYKKKITDKVGTVQELIAYLGRFIEHHIQCPIEKDPTYCANKMEKLCISALGGTLGHNNEWPIFEFRDCGSIKVENVEKYLNYVLGCLEKRGTKCKIKFRADAIL